MSLKVRMKSEMTFEKAKTIAKDNMDYHKKQISTPYRNTVRREVVQKKLL